MINQEDYPLENVTTSRSNKKQTLVILSIFLALTLLLSLFISSNQKNSSTLEKSPEVFQVEPAAIANVNLALSSDTSSIKNGETATISVQASSVPDNYQFLGFIAAIKVPKNLTPTFTDTSFPIAYDFTYPDGPSSYVGSIKDKDTYWEVQALGVNGSSKPILLALNGVVFSFNVTPSVTTTESSSIEFIIDPNGSYPSVVSADLTEAQLTTANTSISLIPSTLPTITLTLATKNVGDAPFTMAHTTNSTGAKTFTSSNTAVATITNAGLVTIVRAGTSTITFSVAADGNYSANSITAALTVNLGNQAPTDIALSTNSIDENQLIGTTIGTLSTTDPNVGDTFTYTITDGVDSASFTLTGNTLKSDAVFDYETKNTYYVIVRSTDQGGLFTEKTFTISINDINEIAKGDIDGNGKVETKDIIFMVKVFFGEITATDQEKARMEMNGIPPVNQLDIIALVKYMFD
ncbi:MAG: cadherin domain-containing protein [bacterium]|nr:cadherin domain-containing protein [bacterium]